MEKCEIFLCRDCGKEFLNGISYSDHIRYGCITNVKYYCKDCNKEISTFSGKYGGGRCESCGAKKRLKNPENNPNWRGGIASEEYGPEFNSNLKEQIHKRDNYTCQISGMTEEEHIVVYGELLSVHHIDYNKKNNNENNLISLSRESHSRTNGDRKYWTLYLKKLLGRKYAYLS